MVSLTSPLKVKKNFRGVDFDVKWGLIITFVQSQN